MVLFPGDNHKCCSSKEMEVPRLLLNGFVVRHPLWQESIPYDDAEGSWKHIKQDKGAIRPTKGLLLLLMAQTLQVT
ncbi:hypothetical protein Y032_0075g957 [Ancylostoma ceylanicum]|uniref:Uncharacterized protein n=1 Tax=Ancylostoma ceylanicum TaxID=53326 RepID=A0A016TVC2_9BILA|nr:hypothetical protein Y032_0075g957 [Ancylostoma ceylanicum]